MPKKQQQKQGGGKKCFTPLYICIHEPPCIELEQGLQRHLILYPEPSACERLVPLCKSMKPRSNKIIFTSRLILSVIKYYSITIANAEHDGNWYAH